MHVTRVKQTDVHSQYRLLVERESVQITRRKFHAHDDYLVLKSLHANVPLLCLLSRAERQRSLFITWEGLEDFSYFTIELT